MNAFGGKKNRAIFSKDESEGGKKWKNASPLCMSLCLLCYTETQRKRKEKEREQEDYDVP